MDFRVKLARRQKSIGSLVCVGLDPVFEKIPDCVRRGFNSADITNCIGGWMFDIASATAPFASMFKPNLGHWVKFPYGVEALAKLVSRLRRHFPEIPIFLDCKSGDIARTQEHYGKMAFKLIRADGMNFSPYMGRDCIAALVDKDNLGNSLVGLCYTSNPSARQIQDLPVIGFGNLKVLWEFIAHSTLAWAQELGVANNAGLVMAAAYESPKGSGKIYCEHLYRARQIVGDKLWFLIPGIGTQGGFIDETVRASYKGPGSIAINSSSEIIFASAGSDYAEAAADKANELRIKINQTVSKW